MQAERIQKALSRAGVASRREVERWIGEGRLRINGTTAGPGARVGAGDVVSLGRRRLLLVPERAVPRVLRYHKPAGEICTRHDPQGRPTVFARLPALAGSRWVSVGRLDLNTAGLLLFTDDGGLANRLMHPSASVLREYLARVQGEPAEASLAALRRGVRLDDGPARFETVVPAGGRGVNRWYRVTLREGRNREVRRAWESQGVRVSRLIRTGFGPVKLPRSLRAGDYDELRETQVRRLMALCRGNDEP